uniref:Uncharacterized protein n=1 Tax=Nelumbo nucifera TaxID=4432 RepID=A0A822Y6J0_NELNU|nr:TPA_asm: hypothetical protein HUJ06_029111 [Nelumbo nucifera]
MEAEAEVKAFAIRALGSLFKLIEVFLWTDNAPIYEIEVSASFVRQGNLAETAGFTTLNNLWFHHFGGSVGCCPASQE